MEKIEALELFLNREAKEVSLEFLMNAMQWLKKEVLPERVEEFTGDFCKFMESCLEQKEENDGEIKFFQISLLRSKALKTQPFYILEAFPKEFYLSPPLAIQELNLWWLYQEYAKFCEELEKQSKRYILKLDQPVLERIKAAELITCNRIVRHLFEESIVEIINSPQYGALALPVGFRIHMGEYRGKYVKIFETDEYMEKIGRWWHGIL